MANNTVAADIEIIRQRVQSSSSKPISSSLLGGLLCKLGVHQEKELAGGFHRGHSPFFSHRFCVRCDNHTVKLNPDLLRKGQMREDFSYLFIEDGFCVIQGDGKVLFVPRGKKDNS